MGRIKGEGVLGRTFLEDSPDHDCTDSLELHDFWDKGKFAWLKGLAVVLKSQD